MSPTGRPEGEYRSAQREGTPVIPERGHRGAKHEGRPLAECRGRAGAAALAISFGAAAAQGVAPPDLRDIADHELPPFATHEECFVLAQGDRIEYVFASTRPVRFGIHYRAGNADVAPVGRDAVAADAGLFTAVLAQDYCLRWEAGAEGAELRYRLRARRSTP